MQQTKQLTVVIDGVKTPVTLTRKRVKNINLRVGRNGSITLSAPPHVPLARIEDFLRAKTDFIKDAKHYWQEREQALPPALTLTTGEMLPIHGKTHTIAVQSGKRRDFFVEGTTLTLTVRDPEDYRDRLAAFEAFLKEEARVSLTEATKRLLPLFYPTPSSLPTLVFRTMTSKWGVCRPKQNRVTLNCNLVYLPPALVDYVICHELAHFKHPDHSDRFWQHLASVMPDYRARKKALNEFSLPRFEKHA